MLKYTIHIIISILIIFIIGCKKDPVSSIQETEEELNIENFSFSSSETDINGKIYLPDSFSKDKNLPAIYLIDFMEHGSSVALDEFEKVIDAVNKLTAFDALVVTLIEHLDIHSQPEDFQDYYTVFKDLTSYVDNNYTNNTSRTFIARGGEAGIVMMTLFLEDSAISVFENFIATDSPIRYNSMIIDLIESGNIPQDKGNKRLHFSFSDSNDYRSCTNMINEIIEAEYTWLQFESVQYSGNYTTTYPAAFRAGMRFIFGE